MKRFVVQAVKMKNSRMLMVVNCYNDMGQLLMQLFLFSLVI